MEFFALDVQKDVLERSFRAGGSQRGPFEHLDDQGTAVKNLSRMVGPGGRLVLTCPTGTMYPDRASLLVTSAIPAPASS